jgi:hypothetical protein
MMKSKIKLYNLPEKLPGDFLLEQCPNPLMLADGAYYHYSKVCVLLRRYSEQQNEKAIDLLDECRLQLEYLSQKFGETGTGNNLISRINTFLNSINK